MFNNVFKKVFGSRNDRLIKQYFQTVGVINKLEIKDITMKMTKKVMYEKILEKI